MKKETIAIIVAFLAAVGFIIGPKNGHGQVIKQAGGQIGTALPGTVSCANGSSVNIDGGTLYVDCTNNRVGGGTTSPLYTKDIAGDIRVSGQSIVQGSMTIAGAFSADGSTLYLDPTNNRVGIAVTSPGVPLDVNGNITSRESIFITATLPELRLQVSGANHWGLFTALDGAGKFSLYSYADSATRLAVLPTSGNVGMGTASPTDKLQVITASGNNVVSSSSTASGFGVFHAHGTSGGCIMMRDTDNVGWTECKANDGTLSCGTDADGVCD